MRWCLLIAILLGCVTPDGGPPPPSPEELWIALDEPGPGQSIRQSVPFVEVRGRASGVELGGLDTVIALDLSNTTLHATGLDVDGDGVVGRDRHRLHWTPGPSPPHRSWTSDWDDTIVRSELTAAQTLTRTLAERHARVALLTYTGRARRRAEIGSAEAALRALDDLRITVDWSGTDISRALRGAAAMLAQAPPRHGTARPGAVLLLSDGEPTVPHGRLGAARAARSAARELAARGVRVYTFGFGRQASEKADVLAEIAALTGGRFIPVSQPEDAAASLADLESARLAHVRISNASSGEPARAVRWFADGSFDGFAVLVPGTNELEVTTRLVDGRTRSVRRLVRYEPVGEPTDQDRRNAARLLVELRRRTRETELSPVRRVRGKRVEIRAE